MPARHHVALDSWRGIAALAVALYHFKAVSSVYDLPLLRNAWLFVDFFFVLSGFVIAANYRARLAAGFGAGKFLMLRVGRLYPLHLVMLLAFIATEFVLMTAGGALGGGGREYFSGQTSIFAIATNLLLVQGLGIHDGLTWNGVAWSISTEMWAYVVFAIAAIAFSKRLITASCVLIVLSLVCLMPEGIRPSNAIRFIDISRCIYGFCLGVLLDAAFTSAWLQDVADRASRAAFSILEILTTAIAVAFVVHSAALPAHIVAPFAFAPVVFVYAFDKGVVSTFLRHRYLALLGTLSYSIYMIHPFVQARVMKPLALILQKLTGTQLLFTNLEHPDRAQFWGQQTWQGNIATLAMLAIIIACSWVTYQLVEAPGRRAMRQYLKGRTTERGKNQGA